MDGVGGETAARASWLQEYHLGAGRWWSEIEGADREMGLRITSGEACDARVAWRGRGLRRGMRGHAAERVWTRMGRGRGKGSGRVSVCVCVCVREREREREGRWWSGVEWSGSRRVDVGRIGERRTKGAGRRAGGVSAGDAASLLVRARWTGAVSQSSRWGTLISRPCWQGCGSWAQLQRRWGTVDPPCRPAAGLARLGQTSRGCPPHHEQL